jgi:hypothetical protein
MGCEQWLMESWAVLPGIVVRGAIGAAVLLSAACLAAGIVALQGER